MANKRIVTIGMASNVPQTDEQSGAMKELAYLLDQAALKAEEVSEKFGKINGDSEAITIEGRPAEVLFRSLSEQIMSRSAIRA